jgi:hypothetical protein
MLGNCYAEIQPGKQIQKSVGAYMPSQGRDLTQERRNRARAGPFSFLRVSACANTVCARHEGPTELMGEGDGGQYISHGLSNWISI